MTDLKSILLVIIGSAVGGAARYALSIYVQAKNNLNFPIATFIVNVLGCLAIGIVYSITARNDQSFPAIKLLLVTGFCGGFTTFSAFAFENLELFKTGQYLTALIYIILSVVLGILAVFLGAYLFK